MAQLGEEGALSEERANFIRAVWAIELSAIEVLWRFLEIKVSDKNDRLSNKWWTSMLPKNDGAFQMKAIKNKKPQEWDITVLAFAIEHHPNLANDNEKETVKTMKNARNHQYHKRYATYEKTEFKQLFSDLDGLYKSLLGESEAKYFCDLLKKIKEKQIYDKSIEEMLKMRDKAVKKAKEEEEFMRIQKELLENMIMSAEDMKDKIKYHTACAYNLATDLDSIFDWIATTAPKRIKEEHSQEFSSSTAAVSLSTIPEPVQDRNGDRSPQHEVVVDVYKRHTMEDDKPPNRNKDELVVSKFDRGYREHTPNMTSLPSSNQRNEASPKSSVSAASLGKNPQENARQTETSWPDTAADGYDTKHSLAVAPGSSNVLDKLKKQNIHLHHVQDISSKSKKAVSDETLQDSSDDTEEKRVSESEDTESGNDQEQQKQKQNKRDQPRRRFGEDKGTDDVEKEHTKKEQVQRPQKEKKEGLKVIIPGLIILECNCVVAIICIVSTCTGIVCIFLHNIALYVMILYFIFIYLYH